MKSPISKKGLEVLSRMNEGWTLKEVGIYEKKAYLYPPQSSEDRIIDVHGSTLKNLIKNKSILINHSMSKSHEISYKRNMG